jgi:4-hydroxy-tetrahydrodipicolinate reductase
MRQESGAIMTLKIGILGARGRMGDALIAAIRAAPSLTLAGGAERPGHADLGQPLAHGVTALLSDDVAALAALSDVLIDFSSPVALQKHLDICVATKRALVVGTTGLEPHHETAIATAARAIPLLQSYNTSVGVTVLANVVETIAAKLGDDWDIEIVEMHHRQKVDAPSGTALLLGRAAAAGRGISLPENSVRGRDGITGVRKKGSIGFASLRGGTVAGDHQVIFASDNERIELIHRAENRGIFAQGAVKAAIWLSAQKPGLYGMTDVLGL